jgi:hypothetical protein
VAKDTGGDSEDGQEGGVVAPAVRLRQRPGR